MSQCSYYSPLWSCVGISWTDYWSDTLHSLFHHHSVLKSIIKYTFTSKFHSILLITIFSLNTLILLNFPIILIIIHYQNRTISINSMNGFIISLVGHSLLLILITTVTTKWTFETIISILSITIHNIIFLLIWKFNESGYYSI